MIPSLAEKWVPGFPRTLLKSNFWITACFKLGMSCIFLQLLSGHHTRQEEDGRWEVSITAVWKAKMQKAASGSAWHLRREKCTSPVPPAGPEVCVLMSKPSEEFWHTLICKHRWANCFTKHVESQSRDGNEHAIIREFVKCYRLKTEATSNHVSHVHSYLTKLGKLCQRRPEALLL